LIRSWTLAGLTPSTVRNLVDPLRVMFREAVEDGEIALGSDPTIKLKVPQGRGRRERVADRREAHILLDALPDAERALWACAFYGGLRRGELRSLRWSDIDFDGGGIHVTKTWDDVEGNVAPKSDAGVRLVPLVGLLRRMLAEHKLASGRGAEDLVFGRTPVDPFIPSTVNFRARRAWGWKRVPNPDLATNADARPKEVWVKAREDALEPLTQHEARHSNVSYMIEAELNDLELSTTIGHSDPRTTKMIYGHLFPDSRAVITGKMDAYLGTG